MLLLLGIFLERVFALLFEHYFLGFSCFLFLQVFLQVYLLLFLCLVGRGLAFWRRGLGCCVLGLGL